MEITTVRLAIIGPRKGQIFIFERASTTVRHAAKCLKKGQELRVVTISWDDSPESSRAPQPGEQK